MKIDFILKKEKENLSNLIEKAISQKKGFSIIDIFDKASFIENLWDEMELYSTIQIVIDHEKVNYPNILKKDLPRFIVKNGSFRDLIKKMKFDIKIEKSKDEIILSMTKNKQDKLNLGLKLDRDRTIELKMLSENKEFFGVRSHYYLRKAE